MKEHAFLATTQTNVEQDALFPSQLEVNPAVAQDTRSKANPIEIRVSNPFIRIGEDVYEQTPPSSEVLHEEKLRGIIEQKIQNLEYMILAKAKGVLIANHFNKLDMTGKFDTVEKHVAHALDTLLDAELVFHLNSTAVLENKFLPEAEIREAKFPTRMDDYGPKDVDTLTARVEAHQFMVGYIDSIRMPIETEDGEYIPAADYLAPKYMTEALPEANADIQQVYDERKQVVETKLEIAEQQVETLGVANRQQKEAIEQLEKKVRKLQAEKEQAEAKAERLRIEAERQIKEIESRDILLWEREATEEEREFLEQKAA